MRLLTPLPEKLAHLAAQRMDYVVIPEFTREFSLLSAETFLRDVLVASLHPEVVIAGYRTTFGHARVGTAELLRTQGALLGFQVEIIEPILVNGEPVSSTRIRHRLEEGDVETAALLLGYPYQMTGTVTHGDGRGHLLGIPTANLEIPENKLIPADGVYAVEVTAPGVTRRGVMSIGNRPTVDRPHSLEVHLLDFHADLYGQPLTTTFLTRLRGIVSFATIDDLIAQIHRNIALARTVR